MRVRLGNNLTERKKENEKLGCKSRIYPEELKKINDMAWETNFNYAVIFWVSPIGGTLEKRVVYSPSYNEVLDWLEHNRAVYENLEHAFYLNGAVK